MQANLDRIKMKDSLPSSTYPYGRKFLKGKKNEAHHSIINSVTNDEDDLLESKMNSGHSIVRSVTNDEDEWTQPTREGDQQVPPSLQHDLGNYGSICATHRTVTKGFEQTKPTIVPTRTVPFLKSKPIQKDVLDKQSFLIRYEDMMMEQEREQASTISHLQFFFDLLIGLQNEGQDVRQPINENPDDCLLKEFSIMQLKHVQEKLKNSIKYNIVEVDKQFLMVMDILCGDEHYSANSSGTGKEERKISWVEIIQCYRNCVAGMQTLEKIGSHDTIRDRAKQRTIALLSSYRESSFVDYAHPMENSRVVDSNKKVIDDTSKSNAFRDDKATHRQAKASGFVNCPLVSFFAGAIVATILLMAFPSSPQLMIESNDNIFELRDVKGPLGSNESVHSTAIDFEGLASLDKSIDESMNSSREIVEAGQIGAEPRILKNTLVKTKGHAVLSSVKIRVNSSSSKLSNLSNEMVYSPKIVAKKDHDEIRAQKSSSLEMKIANALGGTATIVYFLMSSAAPMTTMASLGITLAVLVGRGARDWIKKISKTLDPRGRKRNKATN